MPKKEKKSGEKRNEKKKTSQKDSLSSPVNSDGKEKNIYVTQIRYLNQEVDRYQLRCDELKTQNKDLLSRFSTSETEKNITELKCSLLEKEEEVDELLERLDHQQKAADQDRAVLQLQHSQVTKDLQDRIDVLVEKNRILEKRLAGLEEFQKEREKLMSNMESLEKQLAHQEKEHKDGIHNLEMKALLEKKRFEKETELRMAAMEAEVEHLVEQKLPEKSRLVLQENAEVKARFSQLSQRAQTLMEENATLQQRKGRLTADVNVLEQMLRETARMNCIQKKALQQITERRKQLETEQKDRLQQLQQLQDKHTGVLTEMETLRLDRAALSERCSKITEKMNQMKAELQEERRKRSKMKCTMQEAALILRQALMEGPKEQDPGVDSVTQWKRPIQEALTALNRYAVSTSAAGNGRRDRLRASNYAAGTRADSLDPDLCSGVQVSHCRSSNLSSESRPSQKHRSASSRMGAGCSSSMVPLYRKPVGSQTLRSVSWTPSALGFLTSSRLK